MRVLTAAVAASALLALLAGPSPAAAGQCGDTCATVCLSGGCDFASMEACANGVADGSTCRVLGGTWHEFVTYRTTPTPILRQDLVFQCADPANAPCVIDGDNVRPSAVESYRNWTLEGFEIRNTTGDAVTSNAANKAVGSVRDCWIHDVGGRGIAHLGASNVAERNRVERTGSTGIWCGTAAGTVVIRNNLVLNAGMGSGGRGIECTLAGSEVLHNTVDVRDTSAPWAGAVFYGINAVNARFNVVAGGNTGIQASGASQENLAFAYGTSAFGGAGAQSGNFTADPLFLSVEDRRVGAGSPAIGLAAGSTETTDLAGRARSAPADAGAYEWAEGDVAAPLRWPVREDVVVETTQASPAMALLPGRGPMVAWFDIRSLSDGDLVVSERLPDGTWRHTVVAAGSVIPASTSPNPFLQYVDLAVDPVTGRPAVAWVDRNPVGGQTRLRVARFLGEECATGDCTDPRWDGCGDPALATGAGVMGVAVAFPPDGDRPAVAAAWEQSYACSATVNRYLVLFARPDAGGTWQVQTVETAPCGSRVGYGIDLSFDPLTGAPGLAWARSTGDYGTVAFAEDAGSGFAAQEVALGLGTGGTAYQHQNRVSLAHGPDGTLGIAFTAYTDADVSRNGFGYVQRSLSGWESQAVVVNGLLGPNSLRPYQGLDLAFDPDGAPWFVHALSGVLHLATRGAEGWDYAGLDTRDVTGLWARLAMDTAGRKSLSWQQDTNSRVIRFWSQADPGGLDLPRPSTCDDGDLCTISACDPRRGCLHEPVECDDGSLCTADSCVRETGACTHPAKDCSDGDRCTVDSCNPSTGACSSTPKDCGDGDRCTADSCDPVTGSCVNDPKDCGDGDACTTDACDPATGACTHAPEDCDDGDACTTDGCDGRTGCSHVAVDCDDGEPCTQDLCLRATGCSHPAVSCDDADACTTDFCRAGVGCGHGAADCDDGDRCTTDGCEPLLGCFHDPVACDDGDRCTADSCDPATGACRFLPRSCDDGDRCTTDACDGLTGDCTHAPKDCSTGDPCQVGTCDPATGTCGRQPVDCDDGDPCNGLEWCGPSGCTADLGGWPCEDDDPCTADSCDRLTGCAHAPVDCGDGNACTTDFCRAGAGCGHGTTDCDDGNACTTDGCDPATGCFHGARRCADDDPCTVDGCDPATGCTFPPDPCDDRDSCTDDSCVAGVGCAHAPRSCDDGDPCTTDGCDRSAGCWHEPWTGACDDGDAATIRDACVLGVCTGIPAVVQLPVITERVGVADAPVVTPPAVIFVTERLGVADAPVVPPPLSPVVIAFAERIGVADAPRVTPPVVISFTERVGVAMTGTGALGDPPPEKPPETAEPAPEPVPDAVQPPDPGIARDPGAGDPGSPEGLRPDAPSDVRPGTDAGTGGGGGGGVCSASRGLPPVPAPGAALLLLALVLLGLPRARRPR